MNGAGGVGALLVVNDTTEDYYSMYDGNGNIVKYVDETSNEVASFEYTPFGAIKSSSGSMVDELHYRFSTKYFDNSTNLIVYRYRNYNPTLGKWQTRDPIGEQTEEGNFNLLYEFVSNNPINYFDLNGLKKAQSETDNEEKCKVVIFVGHANQHGGNVGKHLKEFNKNDKGTLAVASGLGCNYDGRNIKNGITAVDGKSSFPNTGTGYIGTVPSFLNDKKQGGNAGFYKQVLAQLTKSDGEEKLKNYYRTAAVTSYIIMIKKAWERALRHAKYLAQDCKCECDRITAKIIYLQEDSLDNSKLRQNVISSDFNKSKYKFNTTYAEIAGGHKFMNSSGKPGEKGFYPKVAPVTNYSFEYNCQKNKKIRSNR
ncbi:RHS repeat-associated core domain-containing protein [Lentisphaerota bacterium WC36G]|nr:RHS repeat-associated core domain-containing protein [Lentisphaerae bacterium WC36]